MLALQILIDGFAISSLYALGATGFTLIFGVSGVLNLSHGAIMIVAAVIAWWVAGTFGADTLILPCVSEEGRISPRVGAVVAREGVVLGGALRGELAPGDHAEFHAS